MRLRENGFKAWAIFTREMRWTGAEIQRDMTMTHLAGSTTTVWDTLRKKYNLPPFRKGRQLARGASSTTWIFPLNNGERVVLRRYGDGLEEEAIRQEHSVLRHLSRHRFPVSNVIPSVDGESFVSFEGHWYAVFEYCPGSTLYSYLSRKLRPDLVEAAGGVLAWYHELMKDFVPEGSRPILDSRWFLEKLRDYRTQIALQRLEGPAERDFLDHFGEIEDTLKTFYSRYREKRHQSPKLFIHGDFCPQNLLVHRGRISAVLDFNATHLSRRVADVSQALLGFSKGWGPWLDGGMGRRFLGGYQRRKALREEELALLPVSMVIGRIFALRWQLSKYLEEGRSEFGPQIRRTIKLIHWIKDREEQIRKMGENGYAVAGGKGENPS